MRKLSKKHKYMIAVLGIGILFSLVIYFEDRKDTKLRDGNVLIRNEYGEGEYELNLKVLYQEKEDEMRLNIEEREFTSDELDFLSAEAYEVIKKQMLNNNSSVEKVSEDISFPLSVSGYPFDLRWAVSDEAIIDRTGKLLCKEGCMETHSAIATVVLMYHDYRQTMNYELTVVPKTYSDEQMIFFGIKENIDEVVRNETESSVITLPNEYEGTPVLYSQHLPPNSIAMVIVSFVLSIVIGICVEYDEKKKERKINEELEKSYVIFAEKMKLYLISGLTVKKAFFEIKRSLEFENKTEQLNLYKRIVAACNKYTNGYTEEAVINEFGSECEGSYRKLCYLLVINLKRGNDRLIELMEDEVTKANIKRKEMARKKGDEASIKLLFPMMSMLLVVMALIILPAYLDFK